MKILKFGLVIFASVFSFLVFAPAAEAGWAPSGSYEATCHHIEFDGDMLTASCQRRDGSWRNAWLDNADDCDGRIENIDGRLQCSRQGWRDRGRDYDDGPRGSYLETCHNVRMDGYLLRATCQKRDGSWRWTSLDEAFDCDGRIANFDGRLVCTRGRY